MNKKGFTLIELLVVIAIMSILTVITVSQFQTAQRKARDVARKGDLSAVSKALQMYYADYGVFPAAVSGRISVDGSTPIAWGEEFADEANYIYMKVLPRENSQDDYPYCYAVDNVVDPRKFGLFAQLENTTDSQCEGHEYICNGRTYCFGYASPNTLIQEDGSLE